jgi:hypothetical protein
MVHQWVSENYLVSNILATVCRKRTPPGTQRQYEEDSGKRLAALRTTDEAWLEQKTTFVDVRR